ncbi:MAG: hypothetical protein JW384_02234 [Nitrosomonadaceae bacterium]|nr:hypothetical protein [Nitrosomonadaceae bacterium]
MRLADKRNIVLQGHIHFPVQHIVTPPLTFDDVAITKICILGQRAGSSGDNPAKAGCPLMGVIIKSPMVITKPVHSRELSLS